MSTADPDGLERGLLIVHTNVTPGHSEEEFNEWYSTVHSPEIVQRGAAINFRRLRASGVRMVPQIPEPSQYVAIYEITARTREDVEKIVELMRETRHQGSGEIDALDMSSVQAGFYLPI
jgi:hypothetical protein